MVHSYDNDLIGIHLQFYLIHPLTLLHPLPFILSPSSLLNLRALNNSPKHIRKFRK